MVASRSRGSDAPGGTSRMRTVPGSITTISGQLSQSRNGDRRARPGGMVGAGKAAAVGALAEAGTDGDVSGGDVTGFAGTCASATTLPTGPVPDSCAGPGPMTLARRISQVPSTVVSTAPAARP